MLYIRALLYLLLVAVLVAVGVFLTENPGTMQLTWLGYEIESSVGIFLLAVALLVVIFALGYAVLRLIWRFPWIMGGKMKASRSRRGHEAVSRGILAAAAGDIEAAEEWTRRAKRLASDEPLTRLLTAQTAQLKGDHEAATAMFAGMLEQEDTRLLGLRGLVTQAVREDNDERALEYAREAYAMRPQTPWVLEQLFESSEKAHALDEAEDAVLMQLRHDQIERPAANRKRAVLAYERAEEALQAGDLDKALKEAKTCHRLAPELAPGTALLAKVHLARGSHRRAARALEKGWKWAPHPDLVAAYKSLVPVEPPMDWLRRLRKLTAERAGHEAARLALAAAALEAEIWAEVRQYLRIHGGEPLSRSACLLMAELERRENSDEQAADAWMLRAEAAPPDPAWVCKVSGVVVERWYPRCPASGVFDSLEWRRPPYIGSGTTAAALVSMTAPTKALESGEVTDAQVVPPDEANKDEPNKDAADKTAPAPANDSDGAKTDKAAVPEAAAATKGDGAAAPDAKDETKDKATAGVPVAAQAGGVVPAGGGART